MGFFSSVALAASCLSLFLSQPELSTSPLHSFIMCLCILHSSLQSFRLSFLTWCPSSLCHFSYFLSSFLSLTHSPPDLVQTADRRLQFSIIFSLCNINFWCLQMCTHIHSHTHFLCLVFVRVCLGMYREGICERIPMTLSKSNKTMLKLYTRI